MLLLHTKRSFLLELYVLYKRGRCPGRSMILVDDRSHSSDGYAHK